MHQAQLETHQVEEEEIILLLNSTKTICLFFLKRHINNFFPRSQVLLGNTYREINIDNQRYTLPSTAWERG